MHIISGHLLSFVLALSVGYCTNNFQKAPHCILVALVVVERKHMKSCLLGEVAVTSLRAISKRHDTQEALDALSNSLSLADKFV